MSKSVISSADLFKGLNDSELKLLEACVKEVTFPVDKIIFKEGEPGDKMYLLVQGVVEIWKSEGRELKGSRLARLKPGEFFGEMSLLDGEPRSGTAAAAIDRETKVLVWEEKDIQSVIQNHPAMGIKIMINVLKKISNRLRIANEAIHTLLRSNQYISL